MAQSRSAVHPAAVVHRPVLDWQISLVAQEKSVAQDWQVLLRQVALGAAQSLSALQVLLETQTPLTMSHLPVAQVKSVEQDWQVLLRQVPLGAVQSALELQDPLELFWQRPVARLHWRPVGQENWEAQDWQEPLLQVPAGAAQSLSEVHDWEEAFSHCRVVRLHCWPVGHPVRVQSFGSLAHCWVVVLQRWPVGQSALWRHVVRVHRPLASQV